MRIIAGEWKGRRIEAPKGRAVRPTSDRAREAWMSIVHPHLPGATVLDLCAGTGALGLEALSRGAKFVDFVEATTRTARVLKENIHSLDAGARCAVHEDDALRFLKKLTRSGALPYHVAFADPPYRMGLAEAIAAQWLARPFAAVLGVEHEARLQLPGAHDSRRYGDTAVTFYRSEEATSLP
ncbi:MAG: 16S rRNA (guanine(966)-N(2))-methyltransferase RsmD [Gemmatimonadota bacterium]|nr:16S rRNA (guanine(966)-N(2))-methyltransferase RsmD [Gemmatimonadota bacterium]